MQDAEAYQSMVDELERGRFFAAIRASEADVREGRVQDLDKAFAGIRGRLGL